MASLGATLWLTGLSGSGKTTIARAVAACLTARGHAVEVLDGDELRQGMCRDLGFAMSDRDENVRRVGYVARLLSRNGIVAVVALMSPRSEARASVRAAHEAPFIEVHVHCSLAALKARDTKGLYEAASRGEVRNLPGWDLPFEEPVAPHLKIDTSITNLAECVENVVEFAVLHLANDHAVRRNATPRVGVPAGRR
jgi:adenylylsulfate kinase